MTGDCQKCEGWKSCIGLDWYNYSQIRWCPFQVMWLIAHKETLEAGLWPVEDERDENIGGRQFKAEASFVKPEIIVAELNERLRETGVYGKLLIALVNGGVTMDAMDRDARDALFYLSGWKRKRRGFSRWRREKVSKNAIKSGLDRKAECVIL